PGSRPTVPTPSPSLSETVTHPNRANLGPSRPSFFTEGQADWLTAPVSKTGEDHTLGGSTPPPSALRKWPRGPTAYDAWITTTKRGFDSLRGHSLKCGMQFPAHKSVSSHVEGGDGSVWWVRR